MQPPGRINFAAFLQKNIRVGVTVIPPAGQFVMRGGRPNTSLMAVDLRIHTCTTVKC